MDLQTPTFFDPDADGIILVPDTVRGLMLLGLPAKIATYAAYALHTAFSYSTSDSWIPALGTSLPIRVSKMGGTRWGKNWGNFERVDWVSDVEIDKASTVHSLFPARLTISPCTVLCVSANFARAGACSLHTAPRK